MAADLEMSVSSALMAFGLLIGLSVAFAIVVHFLLKQRLLASLLAATITAITFQAIDYVRLGHLDPLFLVAVVTTGAIAFGIAHVVGLKIARNRKI
jgi:hypothetical protein